MMRSMETVEHTSELGRWRSVQRAADPRLRAYVHGYFASSSDLRVPVQERHLPSTEVPLLLNFGEPHRRFDAGDAGGWTACDGTWVVGLHNRHQVAEAVGERRFMVVRLTPIGAHLFLGLPMHLLANAAVDLGRIDAALARELMNRVGVRRTWVDRFDAAESLIAERVADARMPRAVGTALRRLVASDGRTSLGSLARELDCSHRTLIARFRTCVGFPPKTVARLLRFNRVVSALDRASATRANETVGKPYIECACPAGRPTIRWADVATDCGYVDQAHLINEFREFSGCTPEAFLRRVSFVD